MLLVLIAMVGLAGVASLFVFWTHPSHPVAYDLEKSRRNLIRHRPRADGGRSD
jgi:hypothetical protein